MYAESGSNIVAKISGVKSSRTRQSSPEFIGIQQSSSECNGYPESHAFDFDESCHVRPKVYYT